MKLKRILAVGTAMLGVSAFVPTPIVQKCVSMVFADDDSLSYGDFTYRISSSSVYNSETGKYESHEYARVFKLADSAKGDIVIPDEIEGYKVEVVDFEGLFYGRDDITSVTFPKYIVSAESFYAIPETCEIKFAEGCENFCIENGFLVQNNASYTDYNDGWRTKQGKSILRSIEPLSGEVTVPEGIVQLYGTFSGNADITTINLPSTVSYIGWYFCADMPSLTAINVAEDNPTYFSYKGALGRYRDVGSGYYDEENSEWVHVPELAKYILAVPEGYEGEFVVDDGDALTLSSICFEDVSKMTAVKLGKDTIFNCAGFAGCTSLEEIELNGEVYSVSGIEKWRQSYYDEETGEWRSSDEAESFNMTEAMFGDTKWYQEQPDGVLYCGDTVIGYKGEPSGDKLDIKDGTRTIVDKAFNGLDIAEANIPASVEYIGRYAFDCPNLTAVNIAADNKEYCSDEGVVYDKDKTMLKLYPQGKTSESYTVPDGVQIIVPNAFDGNKFIKTVDIPDSVYNISGWDEYGGSFKNCTALENIVIPSSVGYLDSGAFYGCKLKSLDLPATLDSFNAGHSNYDYLIFRNPQCEIQGMNPCTLVGLDGSSAQAFAQEHQLEFMLLDDYDKAQATATTTTTTTTTTTSTTTTATTTTTTKATTASTTAPPTTTTTTTTPTPPTTTTTTT
ncbi:MAG: leucine-rich repeat domain-containing protein, partial [Ruminococcus sp.]|nr:leucine-rich repeat domain-containing protein [Ruminococcus sp.]